MGKQVNFYMAASDEANFMDFVRSNRSVGITIDGTRTEGISLLADLPERGRPFWFSVWLWDQDNSPSPVLQYVPQQQYFVVDRFASEVIEFTRSYLDGDRLVRGRIWAEMTFLKTDGVAQNKDTCFRKWFDELANWIKRRSTRDRCGDYVLPGAAEYAAQGGRLVQAVYAESVKQLRVEPADGLA
jgi:hypothetical protein